MVRSHACRLGLPLLAAGAFAVLAGAADLTVPGQFATIQAAIDAAAANDRILVAPGTYNQAINFLGKRIVVVSTGGAAVTTLNGAGLGTSIVTFENGEESETRLEGFTLRNGTGTPIGASRRGGAIYINGADPTVWNCVITNCNADDGGAIYMTGAFFLPDFANVLIHDNSASRGGAVFSTFSSPIFRNCTIVENLAFDAAAPKAPAAAGGGFFTSNSTARLSNCVVWDNVPDGLAGSAPIATYTNFQGGLPGTGNLATNPFFESAAGNDFRLQGGSPCVDSADSTAVAENIQKDLDGNPRGADEPLATDVGIPVFGFVVDMGCYERQAGCTGGSCTGDIDDDGQVGFSDLLEVLSRWGLCP